MNPLLLILLCPAVATLALFFVHAENKRLVRIIATVASGVALLTALLLFVGFESAADGPAVGSHVYKHVVRHDWVPSIGLSLHADVRADRWQLYHHHSTVAADGMTHSECRVHDEDGALVASFTVDAMVRAMAPPPGGVAVDPRTAL